MKAGAQVVITGADTPGPIVAAKDLGRWAVGYDSDNACMVAPDRCLTTPYWSWGPIYAELVKKMRAGEWVGANDYRDVDSGIVQDTEDLRGRMAVGVRTDADDGDTPHACRQPRAIGRR